MNHTICIVTPGYLASTPRVVKEACALAAAGYRVRVVSTRGNLPLWRQFDEALELPAGIERTVVGWSGDVAGERALYARSRWRHRLARLLPAALGRVGAIAGRVMGRTYPELAQAAAAQPAALYIGHYPAGLAAADEAARRHGALLGYDLEDLHLGEQPPLTDLELRSVHTIERRCLPRLVHLTAASTAMAEVFAQHRGGRLPVLLRNTFPEPAAIAPTTGERVDSGLALHWFSQTIGANRGLETAIEALGRVRGDVHLYLRGQISASEQQRLLALAQQQGCAARLHLLPPVAPALLTAAIQQFDIGLALENGHNLNHDVTVSNKFYHFLQSGLPIIATDTRGQHAEMAVIGLTELLVAQDEVQSLASCMQRLHDEPALLAELRVRVRAAQDALQHGHDQQRLLASVAAALTRCAA